MADTLGFYASSLVCTMATPGIPSYAEVQATRRKNASVLASKALGDPASQPSILNLAEEPAPPKSRRRRFIERLPNTLLVASSVVTLSAALLVCADSVDSALRENQVYVSFILPWMTRSRAAAGWVMLVSVILAIGDGLLMWRLARNKDAPPGLLPWMSISLTLLQAASQHAWQQVPVACALAILVCMLRMWDEIRRQRRFRGAELEMSRSSALSSRERIALLEAQLRQAELVARVERDTVRRSETLLHAAREEADTMQGALMVAAAEMERFAAAVRGRYGTAALDSLLASAVISNEAFGRGGSGSSSAGYGAGAGGAAAGASRAAFSSAAATAAASTRARPIAEDYAGEAGDDHDDELDDDHDDALGDGFLADGAETAARSAVAAAGSGAGMAASAAALATLERASDDAVADAHASSASASASISAAAASAGGTVRPPAGPRTGVTAAAAAPAAAAAAAAPVASGSGAASVSGSSVSSRKTGQTSRSGHTGHTGHTGSHAGSRASGGRSRLPATRIVIGADGSAVLTTSGGAGGR